MQTTGLTGGYAYLAFSDGGASVAGTEQTDFLYSKLLDRLCRIAQVNVQRQRGGIGLFASVDPGEANIRAEVDLANAGFDRSADLIIRYTGAAVQY